MGLLEEVRAAQEEKARRLNPCAVVEVLTTLGKSDQADLQAALEDQTIDSVTLATVLRGKGHKISNRQMQEHRGDPARCPCAR